MSWMNTPPISAGPESIKHVKFVQPNPLADHLAMMFVALLIGFLVPGYLVSQSPAEFAHLSPLWVRWAAAITSTVVAAALFLAYWTFRLVGWRRTGSAVVWFVAAWACTAGLGVPINGSAELVDYSATPISGQRLALAAAIAGALTWASQVGHRRFVGGYLAIMAALASATSASAASKLFLGQETSKAPAFATLSGQRNILVISFDGLSRRVAEQVLQQDRALARVFRDFTFHSNAIANSPATSASLRAELYGDLEFKSLGATEAELQDRLPAGRLPLNDRSIDAFTYASYNLFNEHPDRRVELGGLALRADPLLRAGDVVGLYRYLAVRLGTRYVVPLLDGFGNRGISGTRFLRSVVAGDCADCGLLAARLREHQGADWDRTMVATLTDFDGLTARLKLGSSPFSLRYMHFLFTHYPTDFDRSCTYHGHDVEWVNAHQNEAGLQAETACALRKVAGLLARLRQIGAYDQSLIIVKSDHGAPASYFDRPPGSYKLNGHPLWGYDRYRPLLMIKDFGTRRLTLAHSPQPAVLSDLATTLCRRMPAGKDCSDFPGADLLGHTVSSAGTFGVYVPKGDASTHDYATHEAHRFSRDRSLLDSFRASGALAGPSTKPPAATKQE